MDRARYEISTFYDVEASPDQINLPMGIPDSLSTRVIMDWSNEQSTYASYSRLANDTPDWG